MEHLGNLYASLLASIQKMQPVAGEIHFLTLNGIIPD